VTLDGVVRYFETLSPEAVEAMAEVYAPDAFFKDPFNEVRRVEDVQEIFRRMYANLLEPRFRVVNRIDGDGQAMLEWDFEFRIRRYRPDRLWTVHGVSHLRFAPDGRIAYHRDFWDTGEELYAKLPVVGALVRLLRRRMA
jgi:limonene-1,2-epoxide hydrolase